MQSFLVSQHRRTLRQVFTGISEAARHELYQ
jgi:hypothetical protein